MIMFAENAELFCYLYFTVDKVNYREYKILVNFITAKMTLKEIDIPSQGELF